MKRLVNTLISDRVVYSIIVLNAGVLFLQTFQRVPAGCPAAAGFLPDEG